MTTTWCTRKSNKAKIFVNSWRKSERTFRSQARRARSCRTTLKIVICAVMIIILACPALLRDRAERRARLNLSARVEKSVCDENYNLKKKKGLSSKPLWLVYVPSLSKSTMKVYIKLHSKEILTYTTTFILIFLSSCTIFLLKGHVSTSTRKNSWSFWSNAL